ncbi:hypothetical protein VM98_06660 [Streptomyces rubellomurinus subsp. indigoferus]|uniref:SAM-dependent methyltransferase n=1 Tax=Streptomyces rubellomurinus (strain ATCC 31215) TaxID=359131 RepID=A0A0F2TMI0_STRR3|nr:SAM-dependent methyltransferase [Streptomyces rubellomurinus]KJS56487.1 hypothetical protein VM98_06660 [Streptomyces rubellomurinus subsp. indigoferus]KJS63721.1 hypothetical protein VM95_00075 [Streptomyces rubellomurinus]
MQPDSESVDPYTYDPNRPSVARAYDCLLGGKDHFAADRDMVSRLMEVAPSSPEVAKINRAFLIRVVETLVRDYDVLQIIDHGSGLPTHRNVHQVAQEINEECRVVYVDNDPHVWHLGRTLFAENDRTAVVYADMRDTDRIFADEAVRRLIKPRVPTAALFVSVLHCIPQRGPVPPADLVDQVCRRLPGGAPAYLAVSQLVSDDPQVRADITGLMAELTDDRWGEVRTKEEVSGLFNGMEILPPGVVEVSRWRPGPISGPKQATAEWEEYGGLARVHR